MSHNLTSGCASAKPWPLVLLRLCVGLLIGLTGSFVHSSDNLPAVESVQVGFRGLVEVGRWAPVRVTIRGTSSQPVSVRVIATDLEGRPVRHSSPSLILSSDSTNVSLVYQHGPLKSPLQVELLSDGKLISSLSVHESTVDSPLTTALQQNQLILCLGDSQIGFEEAGRVAAQFRAVHPDETDPVSVQHYSEQDFPALPQDVRAWEAVDVCVISSNCSIPAPLGQVIQEWVRQGGRIVFTGGETATSVTSPGMADWSPLRIKGDLIQRDLSPLKLLIQGSSTLRLLKGSIKTVRWEADLGWLPAQSLDGPIVIRTSLGQGIVTAIALDLNSRPFVGRTEDQVSIEWESLPELCRWLSGLASLPKVQVNQQRPQSDLNPTGVSDLQTQLVNALDQFPELPRPSYWMVLLTALLFLVIVGPIDWFLVHRVLKKPHLTWMTLSIWIGLGTVVGIVAASRISGSEQLTRQVDLLTSDIASGETQVDSWLTLTSPTHHRYSVKCETQIDPKVAPAVAHLRWAGRPEAGFRGLNRESRQLGSGASLDLSDGSQSIEALPVRHGDSVILEAKSRLLQALPVTHDLRDNGQRHLTGTISHQLSGDLVDWVIAYEGFAYLPVRDSAGIELPWKPGESLRVEKIPSRLVADYLVKLVTRSLASADRKSRDYTLTRTTYDPLSQNLYELLKTVTYNRLSGGKSYSGLTNATLQSEDLSGLVVSRRAVLFGRLRTESYDDPTTPRLDTSGNSQLVARYTVDGQGLSPRYRECYVRWILPVKSAEAASTPP